MVEITPLLAESGTHVHLRAASTARRLPPRLSPDRGEPIRILGLPHAFDHASVPDGTIPSTGHESPDVVVLTDPGAAGLIATRLPYGCAAILPVIDASPREVRTGRTRGRRFDLTSGATLGELGVAMTMLAPVVERLRELPPSVRMSQDPRMVLLARVAVRDRGIVPRRDATVRDTFVYADDSAVPGMLGHAEDLAEQGLFHRRFFDTLITCPRCASGRVSVREHCTSCRSSDLVEESILHHLRCTYQAPEHEFASASGFACPKCRASLVHFGVDYDRPGSVSLCRACGHASGESSVGFLCLDCEGESGADDMATRRIQRYEISDAGRECLRNGNALAPPGSGDETAAQRVRSFVARQTAAHQPCCILVASFGEPPGRSLGRLHLQTRALFASAMRETFTVETEIVEQAPHFLALLAGDAKADVERALPGIRIALERHLASPPAINYRVHGPDELHTLIDPSLAR